MRHRLARLLMVVGLLSGAAFAAGPVAAVDRSCMDLGFGNNFHTGRYLTATAGKDFDRIVADIDVGSVNGQFSICQPTAIDWDDNGPNGYVAIVPSVDTPEYGNLNAIFQVGIIRCASVGASVCKGDASAPRFYWAGGGCDNDGGGSGSGEKPLPIDLGAADYSPHEYKVAKGSSSWYVYIDGVSRASLTFNNGSRISCWAQDPDVRGEISGEKWDRGDSLGDLQTLDFNDIEYRYVGGNFTNWAPPGGTTCSFITDPSRDHCVFPQAGVGHFYTYTTQP